MLISILISFILSTTAYSAYSKLSKTDFITSLYSAALFKPSLAFSTASLAFPKASTAYLTRGNFYSFWDTLSNKGLAILIIPTALSTSSSKIELSSNHY